MLCNRGALKSPCLCSTVCCGLIFLKPPVLFVQLLKPHTITLLFFQKHSHKMMLTRISSLLSISKIFSSGKQLKLFVETPILKSPVNFKSQ